VDAASTALGTLETVKPPHGGLCGSSRLQSANRRLLRLLCSRFSTQSRLSPGKQINSASGFLELVRTKSPLCRGAICILRAGSRFIAEGGERGVSLPAERA
jgi:hypothetical protein